MKPKTAKSARAFHRWSSTEVSTWPFQVFKKYNEEFEKIFWSHVTSSKFVYTHLHKSGAKWEDKIAAHFDLTQIEKEDLYDDLREWSNSFNAFDNWVNLNALMAISANLETYMASVITLALESDPGILLDAPRDVDGIYLLKHGKQGKLKLDSEIMSCTKGEWSTRIANYEKIFGFAPPILQERCADLDSIRRIRNNLGHSFGRDIAEARKHGVKKIIPMDIVSRERTIKYKNIIWSTAKSIDLHLLKTHIGEYQAIHFYHQMHPVLRKDVHPSERAVRFKKEMGRFGAESRSKSICKEIVSYYESL